MSFGEIERSRAKGRPVNLFLIRYGAAPNSYYAYTDSTSKIVDGGVTYLPVPIDRGAIVVKGNMDKAAMEVKMSLSLPVAELFRVYPPASVVSLTIKQGHLGDPDSQYLVAWVGRVIAAKREAPELVLTCEPVRTTLKRLALRRNYQYSCPHVLYGEWCRADKSAATVACEVVAIDGIKIVLEGGWNPSPADKYVGGMVEWTNNSGDTEIRSIVRVNVNTLSLSGSLRDIVVGSTVQVSRGCSRDMDGCNSHNNIQNFGGCPFIPTKNPIGRSNQFY